MQSYISALSLIVIISDNLARTQHSYLMAGGGGDDVQWTLTNMFTNQKVSIVLGATETYHKRVF